MSISSQIDRINENVANTYTVLEDMGADMPSYRNTNNLVPTASSIKVVRYDAQTLTEAQKAQARTNIGVVGVGANGYTPVKGVDYWTNSDKQEITDEVEASSSQYIATELAKRGQLKPEFANDVSECTDASKLYVLPDGYIYAYMSKTGALHTNRLANAVDTDGKPYNGGLGYKSGYWLSSNGSESADASSIVTGYIPIDSVAITNLVLRVSGFTGALTDNDSMKFYNASFDNVGIYNNDRLNINVSNYGGTFADEPAFNNAVKTFKFDYQVFKSKSGYYSGVLANGNPKYVRFSLKSPDLEKMVVTINEAIAFGTTTKWTNTGHKFVPADYESEILALQETAKNHESRIKTLEMYGTDSTSSTDIPAYIKTEADNVIAKVISEQGNRSFNFIALSDFHYGGTGDNKNNLIRACKAISYIKDRIHIDAVAKLGDNAALGGDYSDEVRKTADRWYQEMNEILKITQSPTVTDLRTPGNHDKFGTETEFMPDNATYSFIGGYNSQCNYVNAPIGYAYKDFEGYKLRVIVLNTAETEGKGRFNIHSGFYIGNKQYKWLIDTLDMSSKSDASEWQILILSHHRADDWQVYTDNSSNGANAYLLPNILSAYKAGGMYSGAIASEGISVSCNFAGKNQARLIGQIHGHHHNYKYQNLYRGILTNSTQTNIMAVGTPTTSFITNGNEDNVGNTFSSVKDTASETAFCVYCIDLDNHKIHAVHYGNGIDRVINY